MFEIDTYACLFITDQFEKYINFNFFRFGRLPLGKKDMILAYSKSLITSEEMKQKKYSPFGFPQIFYSIFPILILIGFFIAFWKNPMDFRTFLENYPSFHVFVSSSLKTFQNCLYISSVVLIFITHEFYGFSKTQFSKINHKTMPTKLLLSSSVLFAYIAVIGILGVLIFPISDSEYFQDIMQKIFFFNLLSYLLTYEVIITKLNVHLPLLVYFYDSLMLLFMFLYLVLNFLPFLNENTPTLFSSLVEYIGFFLCLLKFPICGWELSLINLKDAKKAE